MGGVSRVTGASTQAAVRQVETHTVHPAGDPAIRGFVADLAGRRVHAERPHSVYGDTGLTVAALPQHVLSAALQRRRGRSEAGLLAR